MEKNELDAFDQVATTDGMTEQEVAEVALHEEIAQALEAQAKPQGEPDPAPEPQPAPVQEPVQPDESAANVRIRDLTEQVREANRRADEAFQMALQPRQQPGAYNQGQNPYGFQQPVAPAQYDYNQQQQPRAPEIEPDVARVLGPWVDAKVQERVQQLRSDYDYQMAAIAPDIQQVRYQRNVEAIRSVIPEFDDNRINLVAEEINGMSTSERDKYNSPLGFEAVAARQLLREAAKVQPDLSDTASRAHVEGTTGSQPQQISDDAIYSKVMDATPDEHERLVATLRARQYGTNENEPDPLIM